MTRNEEIEMEIRNLAVKFYPSCAARFELPALVYAPIISDNDLRKKPYRVSFERCKKIIHSMQF